MRRSALALLTTLVALAGPGTALAQDLAIFRDCADNGKIDGTYSQKEFADAIRNIPTDADEYTDCRDVLRRGRLDAARGKGADDGAGLAGVAGGGAAPPPSSAAANAGKSAEEIIQSASPAERAAVTKAIEQSGDTPTQVGGRSVTPDTSGLSPAGAANVVPTPLVVALTLLAAGLLAGGAQTLRSLVLARRTPAT